MSECTTAIAEQALVDFWISGEDAERIEEHLVECEQCAARLRAIVPLMEAVRGLAASAQRPVVTRSELDDIRARGVSITERRAVPDGEIAWTLDDSELFVVVVPVDLRGVERVDIDYCTPTGEVLTVFPDARVDARDTEILIACDRHVASAHAAIRFRVRGLIAGTERVLADCRLRAVR